MALLDSSIAAQLHEAEHLEIMGYDPPGMLVINVTFIDSLELLRRVHDTLSPDVVCEYGYVTVPCWLTMIIEPLREALKALPRRS